jgi:hypothetical protein
MTTKIGDIVEIKFGRVVFDIKPGDDTSRDICFVCSKPATAWPIPEGSLAHGFADINGSILLLCEDCFNTEEKTGDIIIRKYWNSPDLKITQGGTYENVDKLLTDITDALAERGDRPTN